MNARELVAQQRRAQGLPDHIEDARAIEALSRLLAVRGERTR